MLIFSLIAVAIGEGIKMMAETSESAILDIKNRESIQYLDTTMKDTIASLVSVDNDIYNTLTDIPLGLPGERIRPNGITARNISDIKEEIVNGVKYKTFFTDNIYFVTTGDIYYTHLYFTIDKVQIKEEQAIIGKSHTDQTYFLKDYTDLGTSTYKFKEIKNKSPIPIYLEAYVTKNILEKSRIQVKVISVPYPENEDYEIWYLDNVKIDYLVKNKELMYKKATFIYTCPQEVRVYDSKDIYTN